MEPLMITGNSKLRITVNTAQELEYFKKINPFMNKTCWIVFESWYSSIMGTLLDNKKLWKSKQKPSLSFLFVLEDLIDPTHSISSRIRGHFSKYPLTFLITGIKPREAVDTLPCIDILPREVNFPNQIHSHLRIFSVLRSTHTSGNFFSTSARWRAEETNFELSLCGTSETYELGEKYIYPEINLRME